MSKKIVIFDLLGVITTESMFATNIVYPMVKKRISYDLFKKKYLLYALGIINKKDFWEFICLSREIKYYEDNIIKKTTITCGVKNIMKDIIDNGCELYLATEIPKRWGELLLVKAGIKNIFKKKFYSSDIFSTKPFPTFYKKVFKEFNKEDIYYIDDTLINLLAAQKIKKHKTIFYNKRRLTAKGEIDYIINNLNSVNKIICQKR